VCATCPSKGYSHTMYGVPIGNICAYDNYCWNEKRPVCDLDEELLEETKQVQEVPVAEVRVLSLSERVHLHEQGWASEDMRPM